MKPRLGFLGLGWIGRHRMEAILASGAAEVAALADPAPEAVAAARAVAPAARTAAGLVELLGEGLDGLVIATPSALHAAQSIAALQQGVAVFCQKPLGRTAAEVGAVVDAARAAGRLLGVDLSYRRMEGTARIRDLVRSGALGRVYAADLVFHNAYGPDKPWFRDPALSGGGCVMDLGVHLADLALWMLDFPPVHGIRSHLFAGGTPLAGDRRVVEDFALAELELGGGAVVRLTCSWARPLGRDAEIAATFHGTAGGAGLRNVEGSYHDFVAERWQGTSREILAAPPDPWGGRTAVAWAERLARDPGFDPAASELVEVARVLDGIYASAPAPRRGA